MNEGCAGLLCVALVLVIMFGLCAGGASIGEQAERKRAVKAGVAEWVVDDDGKIAFRYKEAVKKE